MCCTGDLSHGWWSNSIGRVVPCNCSILCVCRLCSVHPASSRVRSRFHRDWCFVDPCNLVGRWKKRFCRFASSWCVSEFSGSTRSWSRSLCDDQLSCCGSLPRLPRGDLVCGVHACSGSWRPTMSWSLVGKRHRSRCGGHSCVLVVRVLGVGLVLQNTLSRARPTVQSVCRLM